MDKNKLIDYDGWKVLYDFIKDINDALEVKIMSIKIEVGENDLEGTFELEFGIQKMAQVFEQNEVKKNEENGELYFIYKNVLFVQKEEKENENN